MSRHHFQTLQLQAGTTPSTYPLNLSVAGKTAWSLVNTCYSWAPYRYHVYSALSNCKVWPTPCFAITSVNMKS